MSRLRSRKKWRHQREDPPVRGDQPVALTSGRGGDAHDGSVEGGTPLGAVEGRAAEGEDPAVRGDQPVAIAAGGRGHADDGLVERGAALGAVEGRVSEGEDPAVRGDHPVATGSCGCRRRGRGRGGGVDTKEVAKTVPVSWARVGLLVVLRVAVTHGGVLLEKTGVGTMGSQAPAPPFADGLNHSRLLPPPRLQSVMVREEKELPIDSATSKY